MKKVNVIDAISSVDIFAGYTAFFLLLFSLVDHDINPLKYTVTEQKK